MGVEIFARARVTMVAAPDSNHAHLPNRTAKRFTIEQPVPHRKSLVALQDSRLRSPFLGRKEPTLSPLTHFASGQQVVAGVQNEEMGTGHIVRRIPHFGGPKVENKSLALIDASSLTLQ